TDPIKALFNPNTLSPFGVQLTFVRNTTQTKPDGEQPKPKPIQAAATQVKPGPATESNVKEARPTAGTPVVTLCFKRRGATSQGVFEYQRGNGDGGPLKSFSVTMDTDQLLEPVADRFLIHERQSGDEDIFDKVFVADSETGEVVFDYGLDAITIANLNEIAPAPVSLPAGRKNSDTASSDHLVENESGKSQRNAAQSAGS